MPDKDDIMNILRNHYLSLAATYAIKRIGVFGSYADDSATETSDVDLVIEFEHPIGLRFMELSGDLEHLLGKKVDILTPTGIDAIRHAHIAEQIRERIVYVETS